MYALERKVFVTPLNVTGTIIERHWNVGVKRRASYIIKLDNGGHFMTGSEDLIPADWTCDCCNKWKSSNDTQYGPRDEDGYLLVAYCFMCALDDLIQMGWVSRRRRSRA